MKTLLLSIICFILTTTNSVAAYFTLTGTIENCPVSLTMKYTYSETCELCIDSTGNCYEANITDRQMQENKPYKYIHLDIITDNGNVEHTFYPDKDSLIEYYRQWDLEEEEGERILQEERAIYDRSRMY